MPRTPIVCSTRLNCCLDGIIAEYRANTKAWRKALRRAGIENFRWHDLRHTWASWHVQNGTPLYVLQEMGAWESEAMVRRYAHLAPATLQRHAERVSDLLNVTNTAQVAEEKRAAHH